MNFKTTLILVALLAVVGFVAIIERNRAQQPPATQPADTGVYVVNVPADDVTEFSIHQADGEFISFARDKAGSETWRMTRPVDAPADSFAVRRLLNSLAKIPSRGEVALDQASGFNPPRYSVSLTTRSGAITRYAVGNRTALGDVMYVQLDGASKASVAPADDYARFAVASSSLRDKSLVHVAANELAQLTVQAADGPKTVLKKANDKWTEVEPKSFPADADVLSGFIQSLSALSASSYPKQPPSTEVSQLDDPQLTVSYSTTQPTTQTTTVRLGQYDNIRKDAVYAIVSNRDEVVKVSATALDNLKRQPLDFRDKTLVAINPEMVDQFKIAVVKKSATQPSGKTADSHEYVIQRRKDTPPVLGPVAPTMAPSGPASSTGAPTLDARSLSPHLRRPAAAPASPSVAPSTQPSSMAPAGNRIRHGIAQATVVARYASFADASPTTAPSSGDVAPATTAPAATAGTTEPATVPAPATAPAAPASTEPATAAATLPATAPAIATTAPAVEAMPAAPATMSSSAPGTAPATQSAAAPAATAPAATAPTAPATAPAAATVAAPPTKWFFVSGQSGNADDGQAAALLETFRTFKVIKFIEPGKFEGPVYTLVIHTIAAKAGDKPGEFTFTFIDAGTRVIGTFGDATFEVDRAVLDKLSGDFKTPKPPAAPSASPSGMQGMPGMPGMPGGMN